ncbi:hypothetical protein LC085_14630 [Bacillus tianshenii]|uniref:hypothetical protein n=1 Tax=Sutcliffiella tianshenii TaxID=1463404 RepID=UPI001CD2B019|nr:hypothetical protein [Bacillus tianshenii]MCA1321154.1 hypothetical protein [Bacillus tianshenii]
MKRMFDPTVFDNLKVIIEGAIYDLDLDGELQVVNRRDLVDLATMSRQFSMDIAVSAAMFGRIELSSNLENISGELLKRLDRPGCSVTVSFYQEGKRSSIIRENLEQWKKELQNIWGESWEMELSYTESLDATERIKLCATIRFDRLFYEDNVDDLQELIPYMLSTLR